MIQVLVVDDDGLMRSLLAEWLGAAGYAVREADSGESALQMLRRQPADVLITDIDMPGRDGSETLDEARRILPGLAAIAISGGTRVGQRNWVAAARSHGAAKALAKPFAREDLLAAVADLVAQNTSGSAST